jgi:hypothetical protein
MIQALEYSTIYTLRTYYTVELTVLMIQAIQHYYAVHFTQYVVYRSEVEWGTGPDRCKTNTTQYNLQNDCAHNTRACSQLICALVLDWKTIRASTMHTSCPSQGWPCPRWCARRRRPSRFWRCGTDRARSTIERPLSFAVLYV